MPISYTSKVVVKGTVPDGTATKNVTIATFNKLDTEEVATHFDTAAEVQEFLAKVQAVTSATVTSIEVTTVPEFDKDEIGTPADPLDSNEIFNANYSDITVVPTLSITQADGDKSRTFNIKYMADPVNTPQFNQKVIAMAAAIEPFVMLEFAGASLTFNAKDEVVEPN